MTAETMSIPEALKLAQQLITQGQLGSAQNICVQVLQQQQNVEAMFLLAIVYQQQAKLDEATNLYIQLLQIEPNHDAALSNLGLLCSSRSDYKSAIEILERAYSLSPSNMVTCFNLANAYAEYGLLKQGIKYYKKVLRKDRKNPDLVFNLAKSYAESGDKKEAVKLYRRVLAMQPKHVKANFNLHSLVYSDSDAKESIACLKKVVSQNSAYQNLGRYFLGCILDTQGNEEDANALFAEIETTEEDLSHYLDAWQYIRENSTSNTRYMTYSFEVLDFAVSQISIEGLHLEFGVRFATSTNHIGKSIPGKLYGFDSFEGLPEHWNETAGKGDYSTHGVLPPVRENIELIDGWFDQTLPKFVESHSEPVAFINVDCDLYSSTKTIFDLLGKQIVSGTILVFDEYISTSTWREDEHKAFMELVEEHQLKFEYLAFSPSSRQAVVRIL
ncbi:class I SAM-dependent methyltransferase [Aliikangiella coralliicola]|uniref:Tetratricopeptide repeat protein n=1 Tax=Aliikangiella coralliicola TaxID=2592383 RepID=A0A545U5V5_9GAMM|nr:class I SAM-dependent methyltransferase [Aliikangiella coralliicola]TQV84847.1 tetratricopeptide repeat protein [Aliikangiella coralliicola]